MKIFIEMLQEHVEKQEKEKTKLWETNGELIKRMDECHYMVHDSKSIV